MLWGYLQVFTFSKAYNVDLQAGGVVYIKLLKNADPHYCWNVPSNLCQILLTMT